MKNKNIPNVIGDAIFDPDEVESGYICHIGKERVFIIAENIAQAMDKMEEISGNSVFGYSIESHSSVKVIYCD